MNVLTLDLKRMRPLIRSIWRAYQHLHRLQWVFDRRVMVVSVVDFAFLADLVV